MKLCITGANGFVGRALSSAALADSHAVVGLVSRVEQCVFGVQECVVSKRDFLDMGDGLIRHAPLDCVVHLASRVHQPNEKGDQPDLHELYRETNVSGSIRVAEAAHAAGARRMVFVSSIKAMGDREPENFCHPWRETDPARPEDPYGRSKLEAEQALQKTCDRLGIELVIIRPPLVYGPGVRANFLQLMSFVRRGIPLPLGAVKAERSMIFIDNLTSAILAAAIHPAAPGHAFLVSDGRDMAVAGVARILGEGLGRPARLISIPPILLDMAAKLFGKQDTADRLLRPLRVNIDHINEILGWVPPVNAEIGLLRTAIWYRETFVPKP